jgi:parallel beta-helix repeat protein
MRALGALVLGLVVSWPVSATATDYFVAPGGNDSGLGSSTAPWMTLQKAAGVVTAGDTVTAADGTYAGFKCDGKSGTTSAGIVFKAAHQGGAKITSPGTGADSQDFVQLNSCSYVTVDGFEVSGAPRSGIAILGNTNDGSDAQGDIIQNNHSHHNGGMVVRGRHDGIFSGFALNLTIQDNDVHDNGEHGIYVSNAADNPIIRRNHAHDVGANCIQINADLSTGGDGLISNWLIEDNVVHGCLGAAGINLDGVISGVLRNNLLYDCAKGGITLFKGDGAEASHDNLVVNNTVYNPNGSRSALQIADGANNNIVFNNILYAPTGLEIQTVTGLVHDYNFISTYSGGVASMHESAPGPINIFSNSAGHDFTLAQMSPALDTGVASLGQRNAPTEDLDGKMRPQGMGFDRGCYETGTGGRPRADGGATDAAGAGGPDGSNAGGGGIPSDGDSGGRAEGAAGGPSGSPTDGAAVAIDGGSAGADGGCSCRLGSRREGANGVWTLSALTGVLLVGRRGRRSSERSRGNFRVAQNLFERF